MSRLLNSDEVKEFKKILSDYSPNNEVIDYFKDSNFVVIAGPAGAGKDTLREGLLKKYPRIYMPTICVNTRPPREGEIEGQTYYFEEIDSVRQSLKRREYFQAALIHDQQICSLHVDEIRKLNKNQYSLSILVPSTEAELREIKKDIKTIFLIPPSADVLIERIESGRSLSADEINRRLKAAHDEIEFALKQENYFCIVTDTKDSVIDKANKYIQDNLYDEAESSKARTVMKEILRSLSQKI